MKKVNKKRNVDRIKIAYKIFMVFWILDIIFLIFELGYYCGHYLDPNIIIRYVPFCPHNVTLL